MPSTAKRGGTKKRPTSRSSTGRPAASSGSPAASRSGPGATKSTTRSAAKAASKQAAKPSTKKQTSSKSSPRKPVPQKKQAAKTKPAAKSKRAPAKKRAATLDKFLEGQRQALVAERDVYLRQAAALRAEAELLAEDMEPGDTDFGEEGGEGATIAVERERDLAMSAQARAEVEDIDAALARIEEGTYGICQQCGDTIPKERLKALPQAALCVRCKSGGFGRR